MKRLGNVYEKIISYENLLNAHLRARKGKNRYKEVIEVNNNTEKYLKNLRFVLVNEFYNINPSDYKREIIIDKGKEREIFKLSYYPHRIVQWAIMLQIQDRFLKNFILDTYASIENRGLHFGVKRIKRALKDKIGTKYCLKLDMKKYYPSIDNKILFEIVKTKIKDEKLLNLIKIIIFSMGEKGQPIDSLWSQWAGNLYLSKLDHYIKEELKSKYYFRYCDDIVILGNSKEELRKMLEKIRVKAEESLNLTIKENYQIFPTNVRGVDFLGYRFFGDYILLRKRVLKQMKRKLVKLREKDILSNSDNSTINSYKGWLKFCNSYRLMEKYLKPLHGKKYIDINGNKRRVDIYVCNRRKRKKDNNY